MIPLSKQIVTAFFALSAANPILAALYTRPSDLLKTTYDYVVIGAGVGGGVVASRLAAHRDVRVLLIEAGPIDGGFEGVAIPFMCPTLSPNTSVDWNFTTVPQHGLLGRVLDYPRGRLLGGSSSINYMAWTRGSKDDYDRLADVSGDRGWSWSALEPIFRKIEHLTPPHGGLWGNASNKIDSYIHGQHGPLGISLGNSYPTDGRVIQVTRDLDDIPYVVDMNSGYPLGLGNQATTRDGIRASSAKAYIHPTLAAVDSTLDILINTHVTKIVQTGVEDGLRAFRGVQFSTAPDQPLFAVNATQEVILSAGSISTPHILLLSGIGDPSALAAQGIMPLVSLPDVGQHLTDHPVAANFFLVNSTIPTIDDLWRNITLADQAQVIWENDKIGVYAAPPTAQIGWFRVRDGVLDHHHDVSAGLNSPHYELVFFDGFASTLHALPDEGRFLTISSVVVSPSSRGSITLSSSNAFHAPLINPAFLSTENDIRIMREAIKAVKRIAAAPSFQDYILEPYGPLANLSTDASIDLYARGESVTIFHPVGTARMAAFDADAGVVNPDLTVKKTRGLRIVDASVFPFIPAAHTQAGTYAVAERAALLMRQDYLRGTR
ncbi:GMC oxidoreductase [Auriscalpium vulgare]|uniref:GMC oxidoreductase n=1 Tax=Auriscalpium vulgare TaxID=40419 RepID=A0ACB8R8M5_9AGAM|nr:GMC oxidoreductase [Auriscalpium vulgare]